MTFSHARGDNVDQYMRHAKDSRIANGTYLNSLNFNQGYDVKTQIKQNEKQAKHFLWKFRILGRLM